MPRICDIYDIINAVAPFNTAMTYDNVGLLVGEANTEVTRALVALDITEDIVDEAASMNANLIISHHPVIFNPIKSLSERDVPYLLAKNGIAALCCHTSLDISPVCGVNVALASRLGLKNVHAEDVFGEECVLFAGELSEEKSPEEFARFVKEKLGAKAVKLINGGKPVTKIYMCSGAGGDFARFAAYRGADAYLTGEMDHHEALDAAKTGMTCVIAGHYETEKPFGEFLVSYLKKRFPDTAFLLSKREKPPFDTI